MRRSSRGQNSCWFACQARHKFLLAGWFDREVSCAIVCRYSPVFHSFMPIQTEGRAAGEKAGFFWRGVTESGALDSSLSFLNRLSVGKAMANTQPGVKLHTQRLHRATTRLLQRVATWFLPKARCTGEGYEWTTVTQCAAHPRLKLQSGDACSCSGVSLSVHTPYYPSVCGIIWLVIYWVIPAFWSFFSHTRTNHRLISPWSKNKLTAECCDV